MNPAQKRTCWTCLISLLTLIMVGIIAVMVLNGQLDLSNNFVYVAVGISFAIPLVLIVIFSMLYPGKAYDERDRLIENKSIILAIAGTFGFMTLAGVILANQDFVKTPKWGYLIPFVYIAAIVWFFLSSAIGIILYYFTGTFAKKHDLQGESQ